MWNLKNCNKLVNETTKKPVTDTENKLVVISGERDGVKDDVGVRGKKRTIMGGYEIICVKLKTCYAL